MTPCIARYAAIYFYTEWNGNSCSITLRQPVYIIVYLQNAELQIFFKIGGPG